MSNEAKSFYRQIYPGRWQQRVKKYGFTPYHQSFLDLVTVAEDEPVLECGIGTGEFLALGLARRGARVYGTDIAAALLAACRDNFSAAGYAARGAQGDLENLPFAADTFGLTYCLATTWYLPNFSQAIGEMVRVTRPNGLVVFDILNALHISPLSHRLAAVFLRRLGYDPGPWWLRTPWQVDGVLSALPVRYQVRGFYILLPTLYPNLARYSPKLSYGLQTSPLRWLGSMLMYICRVVK
jgi:SAM-dependent methyltransferase